jgi:hypothetical protein
LEHRFPPSNASYYIQLTGVAAISTDDVWAVGLYVRNVNNGSTLTMQWNGTSWNVVPSPYDREAIFYSIAVIPGTDQLGAVGEYAPAYNLTLIEHYC